MNNEADFGKGKMPVKDATDVISLDDLLVEKFGAEAVCRLSQVSKHFNQVSYSQKGIQFVCLFSFIQQK